MINIKNANIITEDWVNGEWHGFGPDPAKEGDPPPIYVWVIVAVAVSKDAETLAVLENAH